MEEFEIVIVGKFPGMNELVNSNRTHWSVGKKMKKTFTDMIVAQLPKIKLETPIWIDFMLSTSTRKDPDNLAGAFSKFFFDALQEAGMIDNDSQKEIKGYSFSFAKGEDFVRCKTRYVP